jgi:hypothetical protein
MSDWKLVSEELPALGSNIEIRTSHHPDYTCGCTPEGCISKVVGLPELGEDWPLDEEVYITEWRLVQ